MSEFKGLDYGDLDDPVATLEEDDGPRHGVPEEPGVFFGDEVDPDEDGQPDSDAGETDGGDDGDGVDDEDGIIEPAMLFTREEAIFEAIVTNTSGNTAFIAGFIDFNDDGILDEATEMVTTSIDGSGTVQLVFDVPLDAVINDDLAVRFRIGTVQSEVESSTGFAMDGEVEDYYVRVKGVDFGDLDDPYETVYDEDGPRHGIPEEPEVFLGMAPDPETDGQPDPDAGETGNGDGTDEDGIVEPVMLFQGEEAIFTATASNLGDEDAYLYAFADWNADGAFDGPNEVVSVTIPAGTDAGSFPLTFTVPMDAVINTDLGVRFRIGSIEDEVSSPTGFAMDGEVEDYEVRVKGLDYGDLQDLTAGVDVGEYETIFDNDGPRHGVAETPELFFGSIVDVDEDGQPDPSAGEDGSGGDDSDESR